MSDTKIFKIFEERIDVLNAGEDYTKMLALKNIEHKRNFLATIMNMSVAIIAGLLILLNQANYFDFSEKLILINIISFGLFIIFSSIYLTAILAQESEALDKSLEFTKRTKKDFIEGVINGNISNNDDYESFRNQKYSEEKLLKVNKIFSSEIWFILINFLFIISFCLLLLSFIL